MSSSVAVEGPQTTPTGDVVSAVRRMDALYCVSKFVRRMLAQAQAQAGRVEGCDVMSVLCHRSIVRATGHWVHSDVFGKVLSFVGCTIEGVHVKTIRVASAGCFGMAVNNSETLMVVLCGSMIGDYEGNKLYLHSLPGGELLRTIGERGDGPGQFRFPRRVCFGPDDVIIIAADKDNHRLQEFSSTGEYKRSIAVSSPYSVRMSHSGIMIGVGTGATGRSGKIVLLDYASGAWLQVIDEGKIDGWVCSIQFTPDDSHVIITSKLDCASLYNVSDGTFVRSLCAGLTPGLFNGYEHDIAIAENGDILVCSPAKHRIHRYDSDGNKLLKIWGYHGDSDGQFRYPVALAIANGRLYVLDNETPRVQVFE